MSEISYVWTVRGSLHIGTGMSRLGDVDRIIRVDRQQQPAIEGEQVKGAVRGAAERLVRWLGATIPEQNLSFPAHPVLRRLFAPRADALVRFESARATIAPKTVRLASTAINHEKGAAEDKTLRVVEATGPGSCFQGRIGVYGSWDSDRARRDILFLCCSLLATDAIGSRKGTGFGMIETSSLACDLVDCDSLASVGTIQSLRAHVMEAD